MMRLSNKNIFRVTGPLCGKSPVTGEFPSQRSVKRSFDIFFDLRMNKRFVGLVVIWQDIASIIKSHLWSFLQGRLNFTAAGLNFMNVVKHIFSQ